MFAPKERGNVSKRSLFYFYIAPPSYSLYLLDKPELVSRRDAQTPKSRDDSSDHTLSPGFHLAHHHSPRTDGKVLSTYLMQTRNFLPYYATQIKTVETDSTDNWYERTSPLWGSIPGNSSAEWAY